MNKEHKYVIKPLLKYFENQRTIWEVDTPSYHSSATGWDIEARSKNIDLLIEAKQFSGSFLSKFNGLVTSPLANRKRRLPQSKRPYAICWALGPPFRNKNPFQLLWDYFSRNPVFWKHYHKDLKMKYIFIVNHNSVSRMDFGKFLSFTSLYKAQTKGATLKARRELATNLIKKNFKQIYNCFYLS